MGGEGRGKNTVNILRGVSAVANTYFVVWLYVCVCVCVCVFSVYVNVCVCVCVCVCVMRGWESQLIKFMRFMNFNSCYLTSIPTKPDTKHTDTARV